MVFFSSIAVLVFFVFVYVIAIKKKDFGVVDIAWGPAHLLCTLIAWGYSASLDIQKVLVFVFIAIWAIRLSFYIFLRKGNKEDWRYAKMRSDWGGKANVRAFFQIFLLQALLVLIFSSPIFFLFSQTIEQWNPFSFIGIALFVLGFSFESIADLQMYLFKSKPENKGRICMSGLWAFSRHPNYFGECILWWGIYAMCIAYHVGFFFIYAPALLTFLLVRISGVTLLESKYKDNTEYQEYIRRVPSFIPWFSK